MSAAEKVKLAEVGTQMGDGKRYPPLLLGWSIWGIGALLYAIGFFMRTAPAVMTSELMATFHITATELGHLASSFFYAYVLMQIPTGILSHFYGPRILLTVGAFATAAGTVIFAVGQSFLSSSLGLLLVGGAVGVAIVLTIELSGRWLPPKRFALASGLTMVVGVIGAFAAGMPLSLLIPVFGWRSCLLALGILAVLLGCLAWLIVRDNPQEKGYLNYRAPKSVRRTGGGRELLRIVTSSFQCRNTWLMLIIPSGVIGAMLSFTGLWGVPYLCARYGLSVEQAAIVCSAMLLAFAIGSPVFGHISDLQRRRKPAYVIGTIAATACWLMVVLNEGFALPAIVVLLIAAAAFSGAMPLSYALGRESAAVENSDIVTGVVVMGIMIGPAIVQPVTGWLIDQHWAGAMVAGIRIYDAAAFRLAFLPMLGWMIVSSILAFAVRETYCGDGDPKK